MKWESGILEFNGRIPACKAKILACNGRILASNGGIPVSKGRAPGITVKMPTTEYGNWIFNSKTGDSNLSGAST